jgi:hypothetical protein
MSSAPAPSRTPKGLYGNGLLVHVAIRHYLYGVTLGTLARHLRVGRGSLIRPLHQLAGLLASVIPRLRHRPGHTTIQGLPRPPRTSPQRQPLLPPLRQNRQTPP